MKQSLKPNSNQVYKYLINNFLGNRYQMKKKKKKEKPIT